jgi:hypothetical protein
MMFWVSVPCRFVGRCQRFGEIYCLHLQGWMVMLESGGKAEEVGQSYPDLFPWSLLTKKCSYLFAISGTRVPFHEHSCSCYISRNHPNNLGEEYRLWSSFYEPCFRDLRVTVFLMKIEFIAKSFSKLRIFPFSPWN